ncbi:MAG: hypothetical protein KKD44_27145 [Proteobacteria bacterium]|nr:hypothetical protein [Pseudomonadota bacterium]
MCSPAFSWLASSDGREHFIKEGINSHERLRAMAIIYESGPIEEARFITDDPRKGVMAYRKKEYPIDAEFTWFDKKPMLILEGLISADYDWPRAMYKGKPLELYSNEEQVQIMGRIGLSEIKPQFNIDTYWELVEERFGSFNRMFDWCVSQYEHGDILVPKALATKTLTGCEWVLVKSPMKWDGNDPATILDLIKYHKKELARRYRFEKTEVVIR